MIVIEEEGGLRECHLADKMLLS